MVNGYIQVFIPRYIVSISVYIIGIIGIWPHEKNMGLKWSCGHYSSSAGLVFLTFQVRQIWASILGSFALFWPTRCQQDITKPTNIPFNWRTRPGFSKIFQKMVFSTLVCWSRNDVRCYSFALRLLQQRHPDLQRTWQSPARRLSHRRSWGGWDLKVTRRKNMEQ